MKIITGVIAKGKELNSVIVKGSELDILPS